MPVNEPTYLKYIDGKLSDYDFSADSICHPSEKAFALIIFSLGLDRYALKRLHRAVAPNWFEEKVDALLFKLGVTPVPNKDLFRAQKVLWAALVSHIYDILQSQPFEMPKVKLVAQGFNSKVSGVLEIGGFMRLEGRISADNEPLYQIELDAGSRCSVSRFVAQSAGQTPQGF